MSSKARDIHQSAVRLPRAPKLKGDVLQTHIDFARNKNSAHCMTAQSLQEKYPHLKLWSVDIQTIRASDPIKGLRYTWLTPRIVQGNILKWDGGQEVKPFGFKLDGGHVTLMSGRKPGEKTKQPKSKKKVRQALRKATLRQRRGGNSVPERVGGKEPPRPTFSSNRREFGIRAWDRFTEKML
jgi:hypothetical protein